MADDNKNAEIPLPALPEGIVKALDLTLISQGAEALVFFSQSHPFIPTHEAITNSPGFSAGYILKYRPPKPYRHALLDAQLTKHRTLSEVRSLYKLMLAGVKVPVFVSVDPRQGIIWMENISGPSLKKWIWGNEEVIDSQTEDEAGRAKLREEKIKGTLLSVGSEISKLHFMDMVHGDLTTSNLVLRNKNEGEMEPVIIDFGLSSQSTLPEDKAVDLYVLERAFVSTHPMHAEEYIGWLLEGYVAGFGRGKKTGVFKVREIMKKLEAVRLRGRKRSMVG
ncbi:Serine/threonine-protein kinase BUD32 [Myxozyma melibiosi]|uniref:EKC/KEOPS complex subunit BUD32 n=1 Tax=Myxozyma melibiosi TaxID=54550 RepID=A0ABR1FE45_9ASCO